MMSLAARLKNLLPRKMSALANHLSSLTADVFYEDLSKLPNSLRAFTNF